MGLDSAAKTTLRPGEGLFADNHDEQIAEPARCASVAAGYYRQGADRLGQSQPKEKFFLVGSEVIGNTPEQFGAAIKAELARVGKVIKDIGITAN